ncbi:non-ribosomal peptide synthetase [Actinokineospora enzanensis]|uniref:non-ribosomal peptide synthetase n=1 Tax=Actinokineospora enzanensis TaxID=155975 RepID=UPI0012EB46D0|nr:non-ribosomal peptide synthetase [Actinokineospora enzanensis]
MSAQGSDVVSRTWDGYRLSKQQEHVLARADRVVAVAHLSSTVDVQVLARAADDVAVVHESLRTDYRRVLGDNSSVLMVVEDGPRMRVSECRGDEATLSALLAEQRQADAHAPHLILFTHNDDRQSLVLSAPRLSVDTTSVAVFFHDLRQAYAARLDGAVWHREDVVQYADYAQWQYEEGMPGDGPAWADLEARLADLPPVHLPLEQRATRPGWTDLEWMVPKSVARRLRTLASEVDGGLRGVLLTAWVAALWHASGRPERMAVSTVLPRRPFAETATSVGRFECPVPVFTTLAADMALTALLQDVGVQIEAFEHGDESAVDPARQHAGALPGFGFSDVTGLTTTGSTYADLWIAPADDDRKVTLWAQGVDGRIRLTLRARTGAMADGGAEALQTCLTATLAALASNPTTPLSSPAMLDDDAARVLIAATNTAQPPAERPAHWHRLVEATARRTPDATALRFGTRTLTYRELDRTANRAANELIARGVRPGDLVGLSLERSDTTVVALLAIAKAGAGYVPLDPNLPVRRRATIAAGADLTHAVATADTAAELPAGCDTFLLDGTFTADDTAPDVETTDDSPAYVLFTSGSTGTPKGVLVGHGQLAAYLDGVLDRLGLTGAIDSVALGTLGTDLGNTALFPPLMSGGELLVVPPEVSVDAQALAELLAGTSYDLLKITPAHLDAVFAVADDPAAVMPRQALVVGGEPFGWGSYNLFREYLGDCALYNHYGPTETTVGVLCGQVTSNDLAALASTVPLGTPMRHARAYVLDPERRPVPVGVPGELWIGGRSVSRGYLAGTPEQQERFVDDPFDPGGRMYRSGDRARQLPGRGVDFMGRVDRQIKLRGFRVELGEIEAVLRQHPRVTGSLVLVAGESSATHLVAYVIDAGGDRGQADWLREFTAERLPEFMVPAHFVALGAFPLTSTGKIDSALLPEPGSYGDGAATTYVEPRTPTEKRVADVMARLLLLDRAGVDDDFFEIGGHSLLATQLISRLRAEFRVPIKLRTLFERPVVSELAEYLDERLAAQAGEA